MSRPFIDTYIGAAFTPSSDYIKPHCASLDLTSLTHTHTHTNSVTAMSTITRILSSPSTHTDTLSSEILKHRDNSQPHHGHLEATSQSSTSLLLLPTNESSPFLMISFYHCSTRECGAVRCALLSKRYPAASGGAQELSIDTAAASLPKAPPNILNCSFKLFYFSLLRFFVCLCCCQGFFIIQMRCPFVFLWASTNTTV